MKLHHLINAATILLIAFYLNGCEENNAVKTPDLPDFTEGTWTAPNGAGILIVKDSTRILKLSGTNREMGYAHGYLLAREIIYLINNYVVYTATEYEIDYNYLNEVIDIMHWDSNYLSELEGMLTGICDRLGKNERMIQLPDETMEITLADLKTFNAISDWGCSSFSVWGSARSDGSALFARNFDYDPGRDEAIKNAQVIISYDDDIHNSWITASFCGFIGLITGMNVYGMSMAIHDNNYYESSDDNDFWPRCLLLRQVAEHAGVNWTPGDIENMLDTMKAYTGMNLHVTFPASGKTDDETAGVIEFDGDATHPDGRATLRSPGDNASLYYDDSFDERLDYTNGIICTNHYQLRKSTPEFYWESVDRVVTIKNQLESAKADNQVGVDEALGIMRMVGDVYTIHTVIFEPDDLRLHFYLARPNSGAFDSPAMTYNFTDLF